MDDATTYAIFATIALAISEILALIPQTRSNSVIQLLAGAIVRAFPKDKRLP
jgi:hypothetical protein